MTLGEWAIEIRRLKSPLGRLAPFSFREHAYLLELYGLKKDGDRLVIDPRRMDRHPQVVLLKASQVGGTELAVNRVLKAAGERPINIVYYFPTSGRAEDFSKTRFRRAIQSSPVLPSLMGLCDSWGLMELGDSFLHVRGLGGKGAGESIDADLVVLDELDECKRENVSQAEERLSHSDMHWLIKLGTPTFPGEGIHAAYEFSDQRTWRICCGHCRADNGLEEVFPSQIVTDDPDRPNGYIACRSCRRPLDVGSGQWIALYPDRKDVAGYHISQLLSPYVKLAELFRQFHAGENLSHFYTHKLGWPYQPVDSILNPRPVLEQCIDREMKIQPPSEVKGCIIGVDQGSQCHFVVKEHISDGRSRIIEVGIIEAHDPYQDLARLMEHFGVRVMVIDGEPDSSLANRLIRNFSRRVYKAKYSTNQKDRWRLVKRNSTDLEDRHRVSINRTDSLVHSAERFTRRLEIIRNPLTCPLVSLKTGNQVNLIETFLEHLSALGRRSYLSDPETGTRRTFVVASRHAPDHFAHANNYANVAMELAKQFMDSRPSDRAPKRELTDPERFMLKQKCENLWQEHFYSGDPKPEVQAMVEAHPHIEEEYVIKEFNHAEAVIREMCPHPTSHEDWLRFGQEIADEYFGVNPLDLY